MSTANSVIAGDSSDIRKIRTPQIPILLLYMTIPSDKTEAVVLEMEQVYAQMKTHMWPIIAWMGFPFVVKKKIREVNGRSGWKTKLGWWTAITFSLAITWASAAAPNLQPIGKVIHMFLRLRGSLPPFSDGW